MARRGCGLRPAVVPVVGVTDTFNRADSATTINNASDGVPWTLDPAAATWGVNGNTGRLVTKAGTPLNQATTAYYLIRRDLGSTGCDITLIDTRGATGGSFFSAIWFSYDPVAQQGYFLDFDGSNAWAVRRYNAGTAAAFFGSFNQSNFPNTWRGGSATIRVKRTAAGLITVWQNGTQVGSATDATYSGTWVGVGSSASVGDNATSEGYDSFTAIAA